MLHELKKIKKKNYSMKKLGKKTLKKLEDWIYLVLKITSARDPIKKKHIIKQC